MDEFTALLKHTPDTLARHYVLNSRREPVPCRDSDLWNSWFEDTERRTVAMCRINGVVISTVFTGLDQNFLGYGPPLLWETMVFNGRDDRWSARYASQAAALRGHAAAIKRTEARARKKQRDPADQRAFSTWLAGG